VSRDDLNSDRQQRDSPERIRENHDRRQRESPDVFGSRASLRASLTAFAAVLASSGFAEHVAPFIPTLSDCPASRIGWE